MSNINIQIQQKDTNGYAPLYIENDAVNIGGMNVDIRYNSANALTTLQGIANRTIAPDGAYWIDITNGVGLPNTLNGAKICCCGDFIAMYYTSSNLPDRHYFVYSNSRGNSWRRVQSSTPYDASAILCHPTYMGYRVEVVSSPTETGVANQINFSHNLFNSHNGYRHLSDETLNIPGFKDIDMTVTPYGFLSGLINYDGTIRHYYTEMLSYLYNDDQINNIETANWDNCFTRCSDSGVSFDKCYQVYDNKAGGLVTLCRENPDDLGNHYNLRFYKTYQAYDEIVRLGTFGDAEFYTCANGLGTSFFLTSNSLWNFDGNEFREYELPNTTSTWKYMFGNKYRLYLVSEEGDIAYLNDIDGEWRIADQSILDSSAGLLTLKELTNSSITSFEAVTDDENMYIIAIVNNSKLLYSPVCNYQ